MNCIPGQVVLEKFVKRSMRNDGIFILRLVAANAGDLITTDIVAALWKKYLKEERQRSIPLPALAESAPKLDDVDNNHQGFHEDLYHDDKEPLT